ncbi:hypothetical protein OP10G_3922 [Fimbriimonas ginsengisoli Gsoil 348]|uniref:BON domain-containing protein n=2 Tax=Fimbriimonas ginsengisoli TaxID=1005039 RepID=A0A068NWY2_FIMGI|nr:hypothetical protein OP10G_3922 [Fimbriimonas ginsengisoli Gsoil 348]
MVDQKDVRGLRTARTEMSKRGIDIARSDLQLRHGVLMVRGVIVPMPGSNISDVKIEMDHIARLLRQKPEIREVILDCKYQ